jgi:hypothetical protein
MRYLLRDQAKLMDNVMLLVKNNSDSINQRPSLY